MRRLIVLVGIVLVIAAIAGCIGGGGEEKPSPTPNETITPNPQPSEEVAGEELENITVETVANASELNDTSEIGYMEEVTPF